MDNIAETHGMFKECFKCKWTGTTLETKCPQCGRKLYGPKEIRRRGVVQLISGLFLVVFMCGIAVFVATMLAGNMKNPDSAKKMQEQAGMLLLIYAIFGMVIVFGLHGTIMGIWQIATGRRNKVMVWIMWVLLFGLMVVAGAFMSLTR